MKPTGMELFSFLWYWNTNDSSMSSNKRQDNSSGYVTIPGGGWGVLTFYLVSS